MKKRIFIYAVALSSLISLFFITAIGNTRYYIFAEETLEEQLERLQKELEEIKKQKKALEDQISKEQENQTYLYSQISQYNNAIKQTELVIKEKEKQIEIYKAQIEILNKDISKSEQRIKEISDEIQKKENELEKVMFYIYQNSQISAIDLLLSGKSVEDALYWNYQLDTARQKELALIENLNGLKAEEEARKEVLAQQKQEISSLVDTLSAETYALEEQINGLAWQKSEREKLVAQSEEKEVSLKNQQEELSRKISAYEQEIDRIMWEYLSKHPSGTYVTAGTPIAQIGRTGYVLTYGPNGWYYPHPEKEPYKGSHLHLSLKINNQTVNPLNYIGHNGFGNPVPGAIITQGYHSGHKAVDFAYGTPETTFGKPIYAPASGTVVYGTQYFDCDEPYWGLYTPPCSPGGPFPRHDLHFACITHDGPFTGWVSCYAHIR